MRAAKRISSFECSDAAAAARFITLAGAARMNGIAQIARVGSIHPETASLDIFERIKIHLLRKNVTL